MFSLEETKAQLEQVVTLKGADYVYPIGALGFSTETIDECVYRNTVTREPACIVGHVIALVGLPLNDLREGEGARTQDLIQKNYTGDAIELLSFAQGAQDIGRTWGEALETAIENVEDVGDNDDSI